MISKNVTSSGPNPIKADLETSTLESNVHSLEKIPLVSRVCAFAVDDPCRMFELSKVTTTFQETIDSYTLAWDGLLKKKENRYDVLRAAFVFHALDQKSELFSKLMGFSSLWKDEGFDPLELSISKTLSSPLGKHFVNKSSIPMFVSPGRYEHQHPILWIARFGESVQFLEDFLKNDLSSRLAEENYFKFTPAHLAAVFGHQTSLKVLLAYSPELALKKDNEGKVPLHHAVENNMLEVAKLLIDTAYEKDKRGQTAAHIAVRTKNRELLEWILKAAPNIELEEDMNGDTIFHWAVGLKDEEKAKYILKNYPASAKFQINQEGTGILKNFSNINVAILNLLFKELFGIYYTSLEQSLALTTLGMSIASRETLDPKNVLIGFVQGTCISLTLLICLYDLSFAWAEIKLKQDGLIDILKRQRIEKD